MIRPLSTFPPHMLKRARRHAAKVDLRLARAIENGSVWCERFPKPSHVGPMETIAWAYRCRRSARTILRGECDHNFTIWQRMYSYLTGDCPALLP